MNVQRKRKNILLTSPPTGQDGNRDLYPYPPFGLALIAAVLEEKWNVLPILDGNFTNNYLDDLASVIKSKSIDVVGFSASTPFASKAMEGARLVKQIDPNILVVIGGPHATVLPEKTLLKCPFIDVAVCKEGEVTIQEIMNGKPFEKIAGIVYRCDGKIIKNNERPFIKNLDSLPYPAFHLLPKFPKGYKPHPPKGSRGLWTSIMWSRGCPFNCVYCSREASFGRTVRYYSPKYIVGLLRYFHNQFGINDVTFYDDVFTLDRSKTMKLLECIHPEKLGFNLSWDCETRVDLVDPELLQEMKRAGCHTIAYGIEHGVWIHEIKGGRATLEQAEKAVRWTHEAGINTIGYFMIGFPRETSDTILETVEFAKKLDVTWVQFSITTPIPGSELYKQAIAITPGLDEYWDKLLYATNGNTDLPWLITKELSENDLAYWRQRAYKEFYLRWRYLWKRLSSIRSFSELKMNIEGLKMLLQMIKRG